MNIIKKLSSIFLFFTVFYEVSAMDDQGRERGDYYYRLGFTYRDQGKLDDAIAQYKLAIQNDTYVGDCYYRLGGIYRDQGRLDDAIAQYKLAIQNDTHVGDCYYRLGFIYRDQGKLDDAIAQYKLAIQNDTYVGDSHYRLGNIYERLLEIQENPQHFREALYQYKLAYENTSDGDFKREIGEVMQRCDPIL